MGSLTATLTPRINARAVTLAVIQTKFTKFFQARKRAKFYDFFSAARRHQPHTLAWAPGGHTPGFLALPPAKAAVVVVIDSHCTIKDKVCS